MPQPGDHVFIVGGTSGLGLALAKAADALGAVRVKLVAFPEVVHAALPRLKPTSSITLFGGLLDGGIQCV